MNILYLNNEMSIGGVAKCILKLSKELSKDNNIFIASKENGALLNEFEKLGIENYSLVDVQSKLPHNIMINVLRIVKIVREQKIDIIHSHHRMTTLIAKIVSKMTNVKVIHTQHSCIEDKIRLTTIALKNIQIITVSEAAKRILIEKSNLDQSRIITIYNTIEAENLNKKIDSVLVELKQKGYFVVAQVSRAVHNKGVSEFIEIAKATIKINNQIRFVFIGDGPELENMKESIDKDYLSHFIYLLGSKDNVIEHLKYIDLFILCSYIEGLPLSPIEAFSQCIPVVATNIDGTNEEIRNGENGFLVNIKDIEGFRDRILEIYHNEELLNKLKSNAYQTYKDSFNSTVYIEKHRQIYFN